MLNVYDEPELYDLQTAAIDDLGVVNGKAKSEK